jgi:hypothetical protein
MMNDPITVKFPTDFALAIVGSGRPELAAAALRPARRHLGSRSVAL